MADAWPSGPALPDAVAAQILSVLWFMSVSTGPWGAAAAGSDEMLKCEDLKVGQYPLLPSFLGLLKFCTVGFCGIGSLIDFILISMQIVGPSDGSSYIIDYYGTRLTRLSITNETFRKTQLYP
ncbi:PREDICTED: TM2 domain-containing protein 1 [Hipposideros armiger]|uniref:TM2 domain-containing protein 1 n=1 Tax=Hipposideros armiger TaxID=186990 RepID=A0A8B7SCJ4_HIPAR|nr:PREDICTED: TM2 domain-containing protein 1 [Hipposideros armiger]